MGRTKPHNVQVRLSEQGVERMQRLAAECGLSLATVAREALAAGIAVAEAKLREELRLRRAGWDPSVPLSPPRPAAAKVAAAGVQDDGGVDPWST